jgi:hypothetical protein
MFSLHTQALSDSAPPLTSTPAAYAQVDVAGRLQAVPAAGAADGQGVWHVQPPCPQEQRSSS